MTTPQTTNVGILNVTGYVGAELARLLHDHPDVRIVGVTGRSARRQAPARGLPAPLRPRPADHRDRCPRAATSSSPPCRTPPPPRHLAPYIDAGIPVVDVSADFRLKDVADLRGRLQDHAPRAGPPVRRRLRPPGAPPRRARARPASPPCPAATPPASSSRSRRSFALGLIEPERHRRHQDRPLRRRPRARPQRPLLGGRRERRALRPRRPPPRARDDAGARLRRSGSYPGAPPAITFVPHYTPMTRGILSTCYADLRAGVVARPRGASSPLYRDFYRDAPFVHISDTPPSTKHVAGTNYCVIHPSINLQTGKVVVTSAPRQPRQGRSRRHRPVHERHARLRRGRRPAVRSACSPRRDAHRGRTAVRPHRRSEISQIERSRIAHQY